MSGRRKPDSPATVKDMNDPLADELLAYARNQDRIVDGVAARRAVRNLAIGLLSVVLALILTAVLLGPKLLDRQPAPVSPRSPQPTLTVLVSPSPSPSPIVVPGQAGPAGPAAPRATQPARQTRAPGAPATRQPGRAPAAPQQGTASPPPRPSPSPSCTRLPVVGGCAPALPG